MKFLYRYLRPFGKAMLLGLSIKCFGTLIELALPYILSHIVDEVVPHDGRLSMILVWGAAMVLCALLAMLANVKANRMASRVARDGAERIRHDLFHRTMTLSASQIDAFTVPSLEARITTDTYNVHAFIGQMQRLGVRAPLLLVGGIFVTLVMDPFLSLIMLAVMPMIFCAVYLVSRCGSRLYAAVQRSVDGMIRVVREDAQGIRVIKALSRVEKEHERYDAVNRRLVKADRRAALTMGSVNPIMNLLMNLGITFVMLLGAYRVLDEQTAPGRIIAFTQYFTMISNATLSVTRIFMLYTKSAASARRIAEVVDAPKDLAVLPESEFPPREGEPYLVFDDVSFSYLPGKPLIDRLSFSLQKGQTLGIIGSTGSGKTTLTHLLMRFYDVNGGAVRIGGKDVRTIPEETLHTLFGVAMQNDFLYADTIRENIRFGRDLPEEAVVRAAKIAQADPFISALPDGYDHILAQKGANLSGGQKQRLLIARALAANPEILILDDSSSALDYRTDANLRAAIAKEVTGVTSVVVAQRVSSVKHADLILVLEDGRLAGMGKHEKLLETCAIYREISDSQMGGAILD